ncbi:Rrf2 family transcriptional regulator [Nocardia sp. NPDC052566]|uniref:Rrf2 family transcriptional regulator n=1 Tax=Nocardia sp. NPDC052566 TaxID=3364330 RepID=UPI0037C61EDB
MNSRLTVAIHVLTWMALVEPKRQDVITSDELANSVNTNPVVIRRILGQLRDAGLVSAQRGRGAGFTLARTPDAISLLDVYRAIEPDALFSLHPATPNQACPVGRGIQPVLRGAYQRAEEVMKEELATVSIADVLRDTVTA